MSNKELLDQILSEIPIVSPKFIIQPSHHNKVKEFLKKWLELNHFDRDAPKVYENLNQIPDRSRKEVVYLDDWNSLLEVLIEIKQLISQYSDEFGIGTDPTATYYYQLFTQKLQQLKKASIGDLIQSSQYNIRRICLECLTYLIRYVRVIILFNPGAWSDAEAFITDGTIAILGDFTMTDPSASEILNLLDSYKVVIVKEIDTGPYWGREYPNLYGVLYNTLRPGTVGSVDVSIASDTLRRKLGTDTLDVLWDYCIRIADKVPGLYHWATYDTSGAYSCRIGSRGAVVEVPYDSYWKSQDRLEAFMEWMAEDFLSMPWPIRILYLGIYGTDRPGYHGDVGNIATFWYGIASKRKLKIIDMRKT